VQQDGDTGSTSFFAALAVSPAGDLYVGWQNERREFLLARSSGGGEGFGRARLVDHAPRRTSKRCERGLMAIPAQARRCVTMNPNVIATSSGVTAVYVAAGAQRRTVEVRARVFNAVLMPLGSPTAVDPRRAPTSSILPLHSTARAG
jgi:hypothetical protein